MTSKEIRKSLFFMIRKEKRMSIEEKIKILCVLLFLIISTWTDIKERRIYLWSVLLFFILGVCGQVFYFSDSFFVILGSVFLGSVLLMISRFTCGAIGYGDGWMIIVTGIYLGLKHNFILLVVGLLVSSVASIIFILFKKYKFKNKIPFAPCLLLSAIILTGCMWV